MISYFVHPYLNLTFFAICQNGLANTIFIHVADLI